MMAASIYDVLVFVPGVVLVGLGVLLLVVRKRWVRVFYENEEWWERHRRVDLLSRVISWRGSLPNEINARDARLSGAVFGWLLVVLGLALTTYTVVFEISGH